MGQYWLLFNVDKRQTEPLESHKFADNFCYKTSAIFPLIVEGEQAWSKHDRILLVGDESDAFPPRTVSKAELREMLQSIMERSSNPMEVPPVDDVRFDEAMKYASPYGYAACCEETGWTENQSVAIDLTQGDVCLANLCNKEYIRNAPFIPEDNRHHTGLSQAMFAKIAWSQSRSVSLPGPALFHQGTWAGARLAILPTAKVESHDFVDITKQTFFEVYTVLTTHMSHDHLQCSKEPCQKLLELQNAKYDPYSEKENSEPIRDNYEYPNAIPITSREAVSLPAANLTRLELLPAEIHELIIGELPPKSVLAYLKTSRSLFMYSVLQLYQTVTLGSARYTSTFLFTLRKRPFLRDAVKELVVTIRPHHSSRADMHLILLQLPNLRKLVIRPSWITYGPLMSSRYPFKLQHLSWGLIVDPAMNRFLRTQPTIKHFEFPQWDVMPPEWFYFWPDLLPNLRSINAPPTLREKLANLMVVMSGKCSIICYPSRRLRITEEMGDDTLIQAENSVEELQLMT